MQSNTFFFYFCLRIYSTYIPNQKLDSIKISVLRDIEKMWKQISDIKDVKNIYFTQLKCWRVFNKLEIKEIVLWIFR